MRRVVWMGKEYGHSCMCYINEKFVCMFCKHFIDFVTIVHASSSWIPLYLHLPWLKSSFNVIDIIKVKLLIPAALNKSSSYTSVVQRSTTDRDRDDQQWQRQPEGTYSCNECIFHTYIYIPRHRLGLNITTCLDSKWMCKRGTVSLFHFVYLFDSSKLYCPKVHWPFFKNSGNEFAEWHWRNFSHVKC